MNSKYKIKTVIIGLGNIGMNYDLNNHENILSHSKSVLKSKYFEIVGAVDTDKKKRNKFKELYKKKVFSNIKELIKKKIKIDLVIISTSTSSHFEVVKKIATQKFKFCILEKPGGIDFEQFKKIIKILNKNNIKLLINYFRNYLNEYNYLKKKISHHNTSYFFYSRGLLNNCSHLISFCLKNFGNYKFFKIIENSYLKKKKIDPSFFVKFKLGDAYFFNIGLKNCGQNKLLIFNSNKMIESRDSFNSFYENFSRKSNFIKGTYDFDDKCLINIIKINKKAQLHALENMYKIFKSQKLYEKYFDINFKTYELLDKINKKNEKNNKL